jgi:PKD repeat protein
MFFRKPLLLFAGAAQFLFFAPSLIAQGNIPTRSASPGEALTFTPNRGQAVDVTGKALPNFTFYGRTRGALFGFSQDGITFHLEHSVPSRCGEKIKTVETIGVKFEGPNPQAKWEGVNPLPGVKNFFYAHCPEGILGVPEFASIVCKDLWPGIDAVYYSSNDKLKYDFIVHPGADPSQIRLKYEGQNPLELNPEGSLIVHGVSTSFVEAAPVSYTQANHRSIPSRYKLDGRTLSFVVQPSATETIIIDPELTWATYYGNNTGSDYGTSAGGDTQGNHFFAGYTAAPVFPVQNAGGGAYFDGNFSGLTYDAYIIKFDSDAVRVWATYYGGTGNETDVKMEVSANGKVFLAGSTTSTDFPVLDPSGANYYQSSHGGLISDMFLVRFTTLGVREWSTYLGGFSNDRLGDLATNATNNLVVVGYVDTLGFPAVDPGGGAWFQNTSPGIVHNEAVIARFTSTGVMTWSTHFFDPSGGQEFTGVTIDGAGNAWVVGHTSAVNFPTLDPGNGAYYNDTLVGSPNDGVILKFSPAGVLLWSTYFGGDASDLLFAVTLMQGGGILATGRTLSSDIPVYDAGGNAWYDDSHNGDRDGFLAAFNSNGAQTWCTYYGSSGSDEFVSVTADMEGNLYCTGSTFSNTFPRLDPGLPAYFQPNFNGGQEVVLLQFSAAYQRKWATFYGGGGQDEVHEIHCDLFSNLLVTGTTNSMTLTVENPGGAAWVDSVWAGGPGYETFILRFDALPCAGTQAVITASADTVCTGDTVLLSSAGSFGGTLAWKLNDVLYSTANDTSMIFTAAGEYEVTLVASANPCEDSATIFIHVGPFPTITPSGFMSACEGDTFTLVAQSGFNSYLWTGGSTDTSITVTTAGNYYVTVTDTNGCTGVSAPAIVVYYFIPATTFNSSINGNVVTFTDLTSGGFSFLWTFGDGDSSTVQNPVHTYDSLGTYYPCLTVTSFNNCDSTICDTVVLTFIDRENPLPEFSFQLSPNPGSGEFIFQFSASLASPIHLQVVDLAGRIIWSGIHRPSDGLQRSIDLTDVSQGLYLVKGVGEGISLVKKLVVE